MDFNIFSQLDGELYDYFENEIVIGNGNDKTNRDQYKFSQYNTLESIDYAIASKFEQGEIDRDGTPKLYMNIVAFKAETAAKNIDIDVSNFAFIPEDSDSVYGALLLRKMFRQWAKKNYYGETLNDQVENFPTYGTIVVKKVGKEIENIPLQKLRNQQDAKDLQTASYVILEHTDMPVHEMEEMPDWDLSELDLEWNSKHTIYERYGRVPLSFLKEQQGKPVLEGDDEKSVDTMSILIKGAKTEGDQDGAILFIEEVKERPFLEAHYKKLEGRWLGEGEVEKNLGNQVAKNMVFNLRKRGLAWSTKNIFQTMDDQLASNLVRQVNDGDVLQMSMAGGISRIDTTNRAVADFNSMDAEIDGNANQRSFTFEVATGETLPSGTPFRLGALLSNSVNSYYNLKREKLGIFQTKIVSEFLLPLFEKQEKKGGVVSIVEGEESFDILRNAKKNGFAVKMMKEAALKGEMIDITSIKAFVDGQLEGSTIDFYEYKDNFWKNLNKTVFIEITGESTDIKQQVETMVSLYTDMVQRGDPNAQNILKRILAMTGNKMPLASATEGEQIQTQAGQPTPNVQGLSQALPQDSLVTEA